MKGLSRFVAALATVCTLTTSARSEEVRLYSWPDYFGAKSIEQFTTETGIQVIYDVFDSNDLAETKLLVGKSGYDVVTPNLAPHFARQLTVGIWSPIDRSKLANINNIDPAIAAQLARFDPQGAHAVPWMWGTTGIIYNADKVAKLVPDAPIDLWRLVFDPAVAEKLSACGINMLDDAEQVLGSALIYLGRSINTATAADLAEAVAVVQRIRPFVRRFHSSEYVSGLANGDYCVALGFSGDARIAALRSSEAGKPDMISYSYRARER